jgi:PhnB protein
MLNVNRTEMTPTRNVQVNAYLRFNGNCREAMTFYQKCLGGELTFMTVGETPMAAQMPGLKDQIMHAALKKDGVFILMASDSMGEAVTKGNSLSLSLSGVSSQELKTYFSRLSEGGKVIHALEEMFFGTYGDITDRFGVDWMFEADKA